MLIINLSISEIYLMDKFIYLSIFIISILLILLEKSIFKIFEKWYSYGYLSSGECARKNKISGKVYKKVDNVYCECDEMETEKFHKFNTEK